MPISTLSIVRNSVCKAAFLACLLVSSAQAQNESSFGTLFTTPEEREYLDYLRDEFVSRNQSDNFDIQEDVIPDIPVQEDAPAQQVTVYRFGGVMTRRNGSRLVWLNDRQVSENDLPRNVSLTDTNAGTLLVIRNNGITYQLKAGQVFNSEAGGIQESYQVSNPSADDTPDVRAEINQPEASAVQPQQAEPENADAGAALDLAQILQSLGADPDSATDAQMEEALNLLVEQSE